MRESRTYGSVRGACDETHVPIATAPDEVILSRKGAKSRTRVGLRSKTTKAGAHVDSVRAANADLKKKLLEAREQLAEVLDQQTATSEAVTVTSEVLQAILSSLAMPRSLDIARRSSFHVRSTKLTCLWKPLVECSHSSVRCCSNTQLAIAPHSSFPVDLNEIYMKRQSPPLGAP
jgi:hypothetical protein